MFPIPWNFPFRKKNGDMSTIGDVIGGAGSELPPHSSSDAGKLLGVKPNGSLEWSDTVNSEIQTLTNNVDVLAKNGAVNLLPNNATTQTINGITFTVNSDGTITANGTSTDVCILAVDSSTRTLALDGSYRLSGCPSGGSSDTYLLRINPATGSFVYDYGNGAITTLSSSILIKVEIRINSGITVDNLIFKPMIADADYSGGYVPYAMTNRELTENLSGNDIFEGSFTISTTSDGVKTCQALLYQLATDLKTLLASLKNNEYIVLSSAELDGYTVISAAPDTKFDKSSSSITSQFMRVMVSAKAYMDSFAISSAALGSNGYLEMALTPSSPVPAISNYAGVVAITGRTWSITYKKYQKV